MHAVVTQSLRSHYVVVVVVIINSRYPVNLQKNNPTCSSMEIGKAGQYDMVKLSRSVISLMDSTDYRSITNNLKPTGPGGRRTFMTLHGESRKEMRQSRSLIPRMTTRVGTWNVGTMIEAGEATLIAHEVNTYKLTLPGRYETRWVQSGHIKLAPG